MRILVVDDNQDFGQGLGGILTSNGYEVTVASSPDAYIGNVVDGIYDVVFTDERMPGIGGLGFIEVVRTNGGKTPFIMISGTSNIASLVQGAQYRPNEVITKPCRAEDVLSILGRLSAIKGEY